MCFSGGSGGGGGGGGGCHILTKDSLLVIPALLTEVFEHSPRSTSVSF